MTILGSATSTLRLRERDGWNQSGVAPRPLAEEYVGCPTIR